MTEDDFLDGRIKLRQPAHGFRAGSDTVLLAAAVSPQSGQRILDVGCGVGGATLCLAYRKSDVYIDGMEIQQELAVLGQHNILANNMSGRVTIHEGDLAHPPSVLARGYYDQVMSNPPYLAEGNATPPPDFSKARAHMTIDLPLEKWVAESIRFLKVRGRITFIYRADRLHELLAAIGERAGDISIMPVWPKAGVAARRVIVTARRGVKGPLALLPGLVLHASDGSYTPDAERLFRGGEGLNI